MTHTEHFTYLMHLESFTHNSTAYIYIYISCMCVCVYVCVCVCVCVCVYRAASRATVQCKHGKHAGHLQKRLLCRLASKSRQYSQLHSLRACLYVNRHAYLVGLRGFIRSYTPFTHLNRHASYTPLTHLNRHAYLVGLRGFIRKDPRLGSLGMSSKTPEEEAAAASGRLCRAV